MRRGSGRKTSDEQEPRAGNQNTQRGGQHPPSDQPFVSPLIVLNFSFDLGMFYVYHNRAKADLA
jgi:hypothetical protein